MNYNFDKYRDKREKVLGVKKRGISFGTLAAGISLLIILGLGTVIVPKSIAYFNTRHLDDAIYKLQSAEILTQDILNSLQELAGVKNIESDNGNTRVVITFDKSVTDTNALSAFFRQREIQTVLLNHVGHGDRQKILAKEAKF